VGVPNQLCGLNNFDKRLVQKCPPNANAIRSIVFQKDNLAVVNGANTEIQVPLLNFFMPVKEAARTSFTVPAKTLNLPMNLYKMDLAGLDSGSGVKFLAMLPTFGTASSLLSPLCGGTMSSSPTDYIEWAFEKDIEIGSLKDEPVIGPVSIAGPSGNSFCSFDTTVINKLEYAWGSYLSVTGASGSMWVATNGGLLNWNGKDMKLWNTLNSNSPTDFLNTLTVDSSDTLWIGSDRGLLKFSTTTGFTKQWNLSNSPVLSNNIQALKVYRPGKLAIGTDSGLSLFNYEQDNWSSFDIYSTPELDHNNILSIATDSNFLFLGTVGGVYMYDHVLDTWSTSPFNSSTAGWTAPDEVKALEAYNGNLYIGTTGGLVVVPYTGGTASTILAGPSGPASDSYDSLRVVNYYSDARLYIGHSDAVSVYSISNNSWELTASSTSYPYLTSGVKDILPDFLSGATSSDTIFMGSQDDEKGLGRLAFGSGLTGSEFSPVPESSKATNLLLSFPLNPSCTPLSNPPGQEGRWSTLSANTNVDLGQLYPSNQKLYFIFSKPMGATPNFDDFVTLKKGLTGEGTVITGAWTYNTSRTLGIFTPSSELEKASPYNISFTQGSTASDSSYVKEKINVGFYTEDIVPLLGWNKMGKILIHSGAEENYTQGLYLRNPQSFGVNITTLIGK